VIACRANSKSAISHCAYVSAKYASAWRSSTTSWEGSMRRRRFRRRRLRLQGYVTAVRARAQIEGLSGLPPRCSCFDCLDHAFPQIIRIWFRHRLGSQKERINAARFAYRHALGNPYDSTRPEDALVARKKSSMAGYRPLSERAWAKAGLA
jgi:hypothetical protein